MIWFGGNGGRLVSHGSGFWVLDQGKVLSLLWRLRVDWRYHNHSRKVQ